MHKTLIDGRELNPSRSLGDPVEEPHTSADLSGPTESDRLCQSVVIHNPQGLHMRPAAAFAGLARRYLSSVQVRNKDRCANGKSWMDLLTLVALPGTELIVEVDGEDASVALPELVALLGAPSLDDWDSPAGVKIG